MRNLILSTGIVLLLATQSARQTQTACDHEWNYRPFSTRGVSAGGQITRMCAKCYRVEQAAIGRWTKVSADVCPSCGYVLHRQGSDDEKRKESVNISIRDN